MARATFVKAARKAIPSAGIKVGDSYYWWKFRYGGKHVSKTAPRPSQLTQSSFLSQLYAIQERVEDLVADSDLESNVSEIASDLRSLADECQSNKDNMPDALQEGETGQLLERRVDACNNAADEFEGIDFPDFDEDAARDEAKEENPDADDDRIQELVNEKEQEHWDALLEEVQAVSIEEE